MDGEKKTTTGIVTPWPKIATPSSSADTTPTSKQQQFCNKSSQYILSRECEIYGIADLLLFSAKSTKLRFTALYKYFPFPASCLHSTAHVHCAISWPISETRFSVGWSSLKTGQWEVCLTLLDVCPRPLWRGRHPAWTGPGPFPTKIERLVDWKLINTKNELGN